jgi:hypothetical protein
MTLNTTDTWQEWQKKQEKKFSFEGKLLPTHMAEMLAYNGFYGKKKTCDQCSHFKYIRFSSIDPHTHLQREFSERKKPWNGKWQACGKFEECPKTE